MNLAYLRLAPDFTYDVSGGSLNFVSCDMCVYHLWFVCVFPWGIPRPQSEWSLSFDHGLDDAS